MRLLKLLCCMALCLYLAVTAFAHSGKTDSKGGHTNHYTGDYHYHHGYPAHQHTDTNGDGILDCPYKFVDKTDSSSDTTKPAVVEISPKEKTKETRSTADYIFIAGLIILGLIFLKGCVACIVDEIKQKFKK